MSKNFKKQRRFLILGAAILLVGGVMLVAHLQGTHVDGDKLPNAAAGGSASTRPQDSTHDSRPSNHLIHETSPYLLQHAHNPVNWYSWGKEALERAEKEDKPIFISIGYSTCYWCHVMEVESFENEEVAGILNEHFIAIKVDREERPDLDEQYMLATQLMTGRGGWPNSVWLTPDGRPWMAGTYFPKAQFMQILTRLAKLWKTNRVEIERQANQLSRAIRQIGTGKNIQAGKPLSRQLVDKALEDLQQAFDKTNGGFVGAPKFPPHSAMRLLIHEYRRSEDKDLLKMITRTLDAMSAGGIRDHVGGGFHRYATDGHWFLPHFEKMLYDNAQLMRAYTDGFLLTGDRRYRQVVHDIFSWVQREMTDPSGGFYSAIDAGAVGEEGKFYVWGYDEILDVLGKRDGNVFVNAYGIEKGGNFREEARGHKQGLNILHMSKGDNILGKGRELDPRQMETNLKAMRDKLLAVRNRRPHPHKDDKILASWNGLMIGSLAYAGLQLNEPLYTEAAGRAARFILDNMVTEKGQLLRSYRAKQAKLPGYLDDYAFLAEGLFELYEADGDKRWVEQARNLANTILKDFQDESNGGFFFVTAEHKDLLLRSKNLHGGGNVPSANGIAVLVLLKLGRTTGEESYIQAGRRAIESLSGLMWQSPRNSGTLILATAMNLEAAAAANAPAPAGDPADPDVRHAQSQVSIELFASRLNVKPGQTFNVAVALEIAKGWHLYGPNPKVGFLVPSTVSLKSNAAVTAGEPVMPKTRTLEDLVLHETVEIYKGRIWFMIPLTVGKDVGAGETTLEWEVRTQACDDRQCLAPQTTTLRLPIQIDPQTPAAGMRHQSVFDLLRINR